MMLSKKFFWFFILIMLLFSNNTIARPLVIAGVPKEPMRFIDNKGEFTGIDLDIIDFMLTKLNVKYEVKLIESSSRLEAYWKADQPNVDVVLSYSYKDTRAKYLQYAKESHINIAWHFFVLRKNIKTIKFNTYNDLKGLTIGATKGYAYSKEFWDAANLGIFKVDKIPLNHLQMKKLLKERFDTVPMNTMSAIYNAKRGGYYEKIGYLPKPLKSCLYYNTFVKASNHPDLELLVSKYDALLKQMKTDGSLKEIFSQYGLSILQ